MVLKGSEIATNRFGYGAKPGELANINISPKHWLKSQLTPVSLNNSLPDSNQILQELLAYRTAKKAFKKEAASGNAALQKPNGKFRRDIFRKLAADPIKQAIFSDNSISWRLFDFFSNHFSVTASGSTLSVLAPTLEREAIAPNLLGRFEDMLLAVVKHPAMLIYLNNEKSFGANSKLGKKRNKGLNENLAREILELHTLGVNGGYSQRDVTELAKAITGWSLANPKKDKRTGFKYRNWGHEPGTRKVLDKNYPDKGIKQGEAILKDLANHPSTAYFVSYKLARHFIEDNPDKRLVERMANTWLSTRGDIKQVVETLIDADEAWREPSLKFKSPREFLISAYRAAGRKKVNTNGVFNSLKLLGQRPFSAGSPAGFSDLSEDWDGGSALMARIDWAANVAGKTRIKAGTFMKNSLGTVVSEQTKNAVLRAESRELALVLVLMSPEFQRR